MSKKIPERPSIVPIATRGGPPPEVPPRENKPKLRVEAPDLALVRPTRPLPPPPYQANPDPVQVAYAEARQRLPKKFGEVANQSLERESQLKRDLYDDALHVVDVRLSPEARQQMRKTSINSVVLPDPKSPAVGQIAQLVESVSNFEEALDNGSISSQAKLTTLQQLINARDALYLLVKNTDSAGLLADMGEHLVSLTGKI